MEHLKSDLSFERRQLETNYQQAAEQLRSWSKFSLVAATLGLILGAMWTMSGIFGFSITSYSTAIPPLLLQIISALSLAQLRAASRRLDSIRMELADMRRFNAALQAACKIDDPKDRCKLIADLAKLAVTRESHSIKTNETSPQH